MMSHILRIGDAEEHPEESIEIPVKVSKSTMLARPKSLKKFAPRPSDRDEGQNGTTTYAQLSIRTEYYLNKHTTDLSEAEKVELKEEEEENIDAVELEMFEKEELVKGFKYGTTYVTCPDGHFENLPGANVGIHICGFFPESKVCSHVFYKKEILTYGGSSIESKPWERSPTFGQILIPLYNKSQYPLLPRQCSRKVPWQ